MIDSSLRRSLTNIVKNLSADELSAARAVLISDRPEEEPDFREKRFFVGLAKRLSDSDRYEAIEIISMAESKAERDSKFNGMINSTMSRMEADADSVRGSFDTMLGGMMQGKMFPDGFLKNGRESLSPRSIFGLDDSGYRSIPEKGNGSGYRSIPERGNGSGSRYVPDEEFDFGSADDFDDYDDFGITAEDMSGSGFGSMFDGMGGMGNMGDFGSMFGGMGGNDKKGKKGGFGGMGGFGGSGFPFGGNL